MPLFIAQNALLVSAVFSANPLPFYIAGTLLKTTDTVLTITTINRYNQDLRSRLGIEKSAGESYGLTGHSVHLGLGLGRLNQECKDPEEEDNNETTTDLFDMQFGWMFPGSEYFSWGLIAYAGLAEEQSGSFSRSMYLYGGAGARFVMGDRLGNFAGFFDIGLGLPPLLQIGIYLGNFSIALQPFQPLSLFAANCDSINQFSIRIGYDFHLGK